MLTLADLDRDELRALAGRLLPTEADLRRAILDAGDEHVKRLGREWRQASDRATADAQAARRWSETKGYDERFRALFAISKTSTRAAEKLWRVYDRAYHRHERRKRELTKGAA